MTAIPEAGTRCWCWCWGQATKADSAGARMWVTAVEACSRAALEVAEAVAALVAVAHLEGDGEALPAAASGAVCSM